jgi:hypothetical protein
MDSITLILNKADAGNIDLLAEVPVNLASHSQHDYGTGLIVGGKLANLNVSVNESRVKVSNSLTKYYLGNNLQTMRRCDIQRAIEKMSDELHLPMSKAIVSKFDFAKNISVIHDVPLYFNYLGTNARFERFQSKAGLNYKVTDRQLVFYDKIAEMKRNREPMQELYQNRNMLRIESRYERQVAKYFNRPIITANDLYDEQFYMQVNFDWYKNYCRIQKLKTFKIDMSTITTKEQFKNMGVLALVQMQGGEMSALQNIDERFKKRELTKKQAHDQRQLVKDCCKQKIQTCQSELIVELDRKVKESVKYHR